MREIDTETPVVWPAWCYSANSQETGIDLISRKGDITSEVLPQTASSPSSLIGTSTTVSITSIAGSVLPSNKIRAKRKTLYTTSTTGSTLVNNVAEAAKSENLNFQQQQQQQTQHHHHQQLSSLLIKKSPSAEKMLSDRMLMGFSAIDNNKKHCDNSTSLLYDKVKNESQMDPLKNGDLSNNNNSNSSNNNNNNNNNNSTNNNNNNNNNNSNSTNNSIKRERLSPTANGDVQSSISRSRSATPSSFPGTPPQPVHPNDIVGQNLTANLLSSVQAKTSDFQTRNYSDFMRSLAAKYNNSNPNDPTAQRGLFFDPKYTTTKMGNKESPSPPDAKRHQLQNLTPPQVTNVPFMSSLFSSLPFSPAVFPPLIDMSSTQALVTLARAAKEAEIQNILRTAQKRPSTAQSLSPSLRSTLTPTPQQTTQFPPQPFILPTQFPSQQQHHPPQTQSRHSQSPLTDRSPTRNDPVIFSPLDLSSTPQIKRVKVERSSSPSTSPRPRVETPRTVDATVNASSFPCSSAPGASTSATSTTPVATIGLTRHCQAQSDEINTWSVEQVCDFVGSIDICAEYVQNFRDQSIDGSGLPLLTEDHLTNSLGMKLGPALKLRSILAKKLGGPCPCVSCTTITQQTHLVSSAASSSISSSSSSTTSSGGSVMNPSILSSTANVNQSTITNNINIPRPASADSGS